MAVRPERPGRRMPRMSVIARHHGLPEDQCFRCGVIARCERAHLIDRMLDGLDGPQNLVPLCAPCHREQPGFGNGDEWRAVEWVKEPNYFRYAMRALKRSGVLDRLGPGGLPMPDAYADEAFQALHGLPPEPLVSRFAFKDDEQEEAA